MDRFLINMAIIKVNWDQKGTDILDNYIPLVHETLNNMKDDVFSVDQFKKEFVKISEFSIPTGAVISLLNRSTKKYELLEKQGTGIYKILRNKINIQNILQIRDMEQRRYSQLVYEFVKYCNENLNVDIRYESADIYFFEILYEIAPILFLNISNVASVKLSEDKRKYLIARFVSHVNRCDQASFEAILSFVRGSMLTETFYYSQNYKDITDKPLKKVTVYFDTQFIIRLLGYSEESLSVPCRELIEMLKEMNVKMRCFKNTYDEVYGIFFAYVKKIGQNTYIPSNRPGDAFDYFRNKNFTPSDVLVILETLEDKLRENDIYVEEKPKIIQKYSIDEAKFSSELRAIFEHQSEKARNHDIDCIQAIFQLREGKKENYLESCKAIFITTNSDLARNVTLFFNREYGHCNAPVCMADHVFTSLVWMKSVRKAPNLPKDRLVANCYSALMPSESLWSKYINEVNRLKEKGTISENDYHVLIYSITARDQLVEQAFSGNENIFGSVEEILEKAKNSYIDEVSKELYSVKNNYDSQKCRLDKIIATIQKYIYKSILSIMLLLWMFILIYASFFTYPDSIYELNIKTVIFAIYIFVGVMNLYFGFEIYRFCNRHSEKVSLFLSEKIKKYLVV